MFVPDPETEDEGVAVQTQRGEEFCGFAVGGTVAGQPFVRVQVPKTAEGREAEGVQRETLVPVRDIRSIDVYDREGVIAHVAWQFDTEPF